MQHMQFIMAFIIRNRYRAIKSKIAITVCVRLKKSIFLYATVSRIVSVTDITHLLSVIWHATSTRTYRIISAAAQKPNQNPCGPGSVPLCTIGMYALSEINLAYSASVILRSDGLLYW